MDHDRGQEEYIRQVWKRIAKRRVRWGRSAVPDRILATQLFQRGVSVSVIENAFVLAAVRRLMRPADVPPLGTIRSLAYFLPVIEEVLALHVNPEYFHYLRHKFERIAPTR
jgi:hypothetical protein